MPNRLLSNNELATKGHTIKYRPWDIVYTEEYLAKTEALKREKYLKSTQARILARSVILEKFGSSNS